MISSRGLAVLLLLTEIGEPFLEVFLCPGLGLRRKGRVSPSEGTPRNGKAQDAHQANQQYEPSQASRQSLGGTHSEWLLESRSRGTCRVARRRPGRGTGGRDPQQAHEPVVRDLHGGLPTFGATREM